jgi:catalase
MSEAKKLTTTAGAPVADNQNALTAGPRGAGRAGQKGKVGKV